MSRPPFSPWPTAAACRVTVLGMTLLAAVAGAAPGRAATARGDDCHPDVDRELPQFVVGYGSLMESASKRRTAPDTGENLPVVVSDYQRQWNSRGSLVGFSTTYLGVRSVSGVEMVAALYRVFAASDILATDERESFYCRELVGPGKVRMLDGSATPKTGQIWIYVNQPDAIEPPSERFPIVQSYVDIFLTGCFELQARVLDPKYAGFAEKCVETTAGWSEHWVNDRLYPRRPFIYQPNASKIDQLLQEKLPDLFARIRIE